MDIVIDAKTGQAVHSQNTGGVVGFCSWRRLAELFQEAGEIRPTEELLSYTLGSDGIHYRIRQR